MSKKSDICKIKSRVSELERCKLPKTCYLTCELFEGPNAGSYRRAANFGGGDNVQNQGMGAFTGTNPNWTTQPWLGNAQGPVVASAGTGHFFDRSGGGAARERISHEAYLYIPAEHIQAADEIRFLSIGEQFSQVRISPAGGDLNAATTVGTVNYLGPPNTRQIGGIVAVNQNEVYGILVYVLDRQDNADTRIQYRSNGGAWVNMPLNWLYPNLVDAQAAQSIDITWCVQGEIGTNDVDDRRLTELEVQNLGVSSEVVDCALDPIVQEKFDDITRQVYRLTENGLREVNFRRWADAESVEHDNVDVIFTSTVDPNTGFPTHPNTPTSTTLEPDWAFAGADRQGEIWAWVEFDEPTWVRDNNANTGERGEVWIGYNCGVPRLVQQTTADTSTGDTALLDLVQLPAGRHLIYVRYSDFTANSGFNLQFTTDLVNIAFANVTAATHDFWSTPPTVECLSIPICDDTPDGYQDCYPDQKIDVPLADIEQNPTIPVSITNIDLQPTANPNEFTVAIDWVDGDGNAQTTTDPTPIQVTNPTVTTGTVYSEEYFARTANGTTQSSARNMTITRTALGQWDAVLTPAHPEGVNYHPSIVTEEQSNVRDTPDVTVVQGSQTANGFSLQITTGDNGGASDIYADAPFTIGIDAPVTVVTGVA